MKTLLLFLGLIFAGFANAQVQETRPVYYFNPNWSPNGQQIVFESTKDGKFAIYTIRKDGTDLRKLTGGEANDEQPRWSPDGRQIVFISDRSGDLRLYIMKSDGTLQRRLSGTEDTDYLPEFSPKGEMVAFQSRPEKAMIAHDIYIIRTDGTGRTRLTGEGTDDMSPRWSPDGAKILFSRAVVTQKYWRELSKEDAAAMKRSEEIFLMNRDGSNLQNLTNNNVPDYAAEWSKNGQTIYFISERDGSPNIYAMQSDGSKVRKVVDGSIVKDINLSPDEKYFAYTKEVNKKWGLYIYDLKNAKEQRLIGE